MNPAKAIDNLSKQNPLLLAGAAALLIYVVYSLARKTVTDTVRGAGGLLSGTNAITKDTAYEGKGVLGTLGGAVDSITGGFTSTVGGWIAATLPAGGPGEMLYYTVTLPGGDRASIPSGSVAKSGAFTYKGVKYILGTQDGKRVARYAS